MESCICEWKSLFQKCTKIWIVSCISSEALISHTFMNLPQLFWFCFLTWISVLSTRPFQRGACSKGVSKGQIKGKQFLVPLRTHQKPPKCKGKWPHWFRNSSKIKKKVQLSEDKPNQTYLHSPKSWACAGDSSGPGRDHAHHSVHGSLEFLPYHP